MSKSIHIFACVALLVAVILWAGAVLGASSIMDRATQQAISTKAALTRSSQATLNAQVHALAESTKDPRNKLDSILNTDVVSMIDTIDSVGKSSGTTVQVNDATPDVFKKAVGLESIHTVVFTIQGTGTFAQLMHVVQMYEKLPLVSTIDQVELQRSTPPGEKKVEWELNARIRVLTSAAVSL